MADDADRILDEDYVLPHLREGEKVRVRLATTTSRGGGARFLDALGPVAIFVEALFSGPAFAILTDQRLLISYITVLKSNQTADPVEFDGIRAVRFRRGLFHKALSIETADGRRYRMTVVTLSPFKKQRDAITELFESLHGSAARQPA